MKKRIMYMLLCLSLCGALLCGCGKKEEVTPPAEPAVVEETAVQPGAEAAPEPGTLLEEGTGLNENYYKDVSYFGGGPALYDSYFQLGVNTMVFDANAQPVLGAVTIYYGEDTLFRTAILQGDSYEIYAGSREDLEKYAADKAYSFDVYLEDPEAEELYAKEIRISRIIFD